MNTPGSINQLSLLPMSLTFDYSLHTAEGPWKPRAAEGSQAGPEPVPVLETESPLG